MRRADRKIARHRAVHISEPPQRVPTYERKSTEDILHKALSELVRPAEPLTPNLERTIPHRHR